MTKTKPGLKITAFLCPSLFLPLYVFVSNKQQESNRKSVRFDPATFIHSVSQSVNEWVCLVDCSIDTVLTFWIITITLPVKIFGCCLLHISTIFRMSILCLHICYEWIWLIFITHTRFLWWNLIHPIWWMKIPSISM